MFVLFDLLQRSEDLKKFEIFLEVLMFYFSNVRYLIKIDFSEVFS